MKFNLLFSNFDLLNTPDKIQKFKQTVLQLAVHGKLVSQNPNDGPASELLKRIQAEKERFIAEGKIKKEKPLPPILAEEISYELPEGWEWVRLGEIGFTNVGLTYSPKDITDDGTPVLRASNIKNGEINLEDLVRVNKKLDEKVLVNEGDLLICARSGSIKLVGKCCIIKELSEKMAFGAFMAIFRSQFNAFIKYFLESPVYRNRLEGVSTTTINQITQSNLKSTVIALPPIPEQKRIVEKVDELFMKADEIESQLKKADEDIVLLNKSALYKLNNSNGNGEFKEHSKFIFNNFDLLYSDERNVEELKKTILQLAVQGKLVPQEPKDEPASELLTKIKAEKEKLINEGKIKKEKALQSISEDEIPYELPKGWEWVRLGNIYDNLGQKKPDKKFTYIDVSSINKEQGVIYDNLQIIEAKDAPSRARKIVERDTVIYSTVRPYLLNIAIVNKEFNPEPIVSTAFSVMKPFQGIYNKYLYYYLRSQPFIDYVESKMVGMAYPAINDSQFKFGLIPIPPSNEQIRIIDKVDELMKFCNELESKITQSKVQSEKLVDAILNQAIH